MRAKGSFLLLCSFVLIVSLLIVPYEAKRKKGSRNFIRIAQLMDCPGQRSSTNLVNVSQVAFTGGAINGLYIIHEDFPPKMMAFFEANKCKTLEDPNCVPFVSGMVDWCKIIVDKGQFYSAFFMAFHPPMKCPIKKGTYEIRNGTMSYEAMENLMKYIPAEYHQVFWKLKYVITPPGKPDKIKSCFYFTFKYYSKRTK